MQVADLRDNARSTASIGGSERAVQDSSIPSAVAVDEHNRGDTILPGFPPHAAASHSSDAVTASATTHAGPISSAQAPNIWAPISLHAYPSCCDFHEAGRTGAEQILIASERLTMEELVENKLMLKKLSKYVL